MKSRKHVISSLFATLLAGILLVGPAVAQQQEAPPPPPQEQQPAPEVDVDEEELATVAEAYVAVQTLTNEFNQMVQEAEDAEEAQAVQAEYAERANETIRDHDLSVERYDNVVRAATEDDELRNRLLTEIESIMGDTGGN